MSSILDNPSHPCVSNAGGSCEAYDVEIRLARDSSIVRRVGEQVVTDPSVHKLGHAVDGEVVAADRDRRAPRHRHERVETVAVGQLAEAAAVVAGLTAYRASAAATGAPTAPRVPVATAAR